MSIEMPKDIFFFSERTPSERPEFYLVFELSQEVRSGKTPSCIFTGHFHRRGVSRDTSKGDTGHGGHNTMEFMSN